MIGTTIGKYRILGRLGRGATGVVYHAIDETLDRAVAIKALNPGLADGDIAKRFRAEATILARLSHPDIATVYELVQHDADLLMVMELVRGETIEQLCERVGPMPPNRAAHLVDRILSALDHAHRAGVVHRDIKPANVMVTEMGGIKIMDFGIARIRGAEHMTVDGCTIGTPAYMAPEQVLGEEVDGRSDLYSTAVIFYRLLAGRLPFEAPSPMAMLQKQMADTPPPLTVHRPDLPDWCDAIVQRALMKAPADRYQSAEEFRSALARASGVSPLHSSYAAEPEPRGAATVAVRTLETVAASATEFDLQAPAAARPFDARCAAVLEGLKRAGRAREGTLLALAIVCAAFGYLALDSSQKLPIPFVNADTLPTVAFDIRILVGSGTRQRERGAQLVLGDGRVSVTAGAAAEAPLYSVAYGDVLSVTYSRGPNPMWRSPGGPATVVRYTGGTLGRFGIFVERQWLSLETATADKFIVLRVDDAAVTKILAALEQRTGRTPAILGRR